MKKVKKVFKKVLKWIILAITLIIATLASVAGILFFKDEKLNKKKEKIINENSELIEKSEEQEKEHEKEILDSNSTYNDLINGKRKKE